MTRGQGGFTLLELVAVLTLVALLSMVILPSFVKGTSSIEARLCRDQIARDIRAARAEAIGKLLETQVYFRTVSYDLDLGDGVPITRTVPVGFTLAWQAPDMAAAPAAGGEEPATTPSPTPWATPAPSPEGTAGDRDEQADENPWSGTLSFDPAGASLGGRLAVMCPSGRTFTLSVEEDGTFAWE